MKFAFEHNNLNVLNLDASIEFYEKALGFKEIKRYSPKDGSFILVYLGDGITSHQLELTWLKDRIEPYDLGDNEFHIALTVDDFDAAYEHHKTMGCICYENKAMGIYFINDPDEYWIEILPSRKMTPNISCSVD